MAQINDANQAVDDRQSERRECKRKRDKRGVNTDAYCSLHELHPHRTK
jgi:hypothetical protein